VAERVPQGRKIVGFDVDEARNDGVEGALILSLTGGGDCAERSAME
jgi:hypothetical protein